MATSTGRWIAIRRDCSNGYLGPDHGHGSLRGKPLISVRFQSEKKNRQEIYIKRFVVRN